MSQQEFVPQSQGKREEYLEEERNYGRRVKKSKTSDMPKSDHPSAYDDSVPPHSYPAQDSVNFTPPPVQRERQQQQRQRFSPDGDAFESSYQPYRRQQQQVPPWARPQQNNRHLLGWVIIILMGLMFFKVFLFAGALVIGMIASAILLLLIIGLTILMALVIPTLIILGMLGVPWRFWWFRGSYFRRWRSYW